jgi:hypothetical protein
MTYRTKMASSAAAMSLLGSFSPAERAAGRYLRDGEGHKPAVKSVADLAAEIKAEHTKAFDKVKEIAEKAHRRGQGRQRPATSVKETADEALIKLNTLGEQLPDMEQKLARAWRRQGRREVRRPAVRRGREGQGLPRQTSPRGRSTSP